MSIAYPCPIWTVILCCIACAVITGCGAQKTYKGVTPGTKPYTIRGKTYYPLKSARNFLEEGVASWYGPGFHGKTTANGETYNQYAMTAAHKILPLGTEVRVTHLGNGKSIVVRINDRGPFVDDRIIDLSRTAATRLNIIGTGTGRVRVQSIGDVRGVMTASNEDAQNTIIKNTGKNTQKNAEAPPTNIKGNYYVQAGAFGSRENANKLISTLKKAGQKGRLVFGNNSMWNVQIGPWPDLLSAQNSLTAFRAQYPNAFVVGE